ncbi:MAG: hypothetical protein HRT87_06120 [Legionellales bacterium]|nr:hypothetical protein [Legionellales bacterium]
MLKNRIMYGIFAIFVLVGIVEASSGLYISAHLCDLNTGAEIDIFWEVLADGKTVHTSKKFTLRNSETHAFEEEVPINILVQVNRAKKVQVKYTYAHKKYTNNSIFLPFDEKDKKLISGFTRIFSKNSSQDQPIVINNIVYNYYVGYTITVNIEKSKKSDNLFKFDKAIQLDFYKANKNSEVKQNNCEKDVKSSYTKEHKGNFIIERYL